MRRSILPIGLLVIWLAVPHGPPSVPLPSEIRHFPALSPSRMTTETYHQTPLAWPALPGDVPVLAKSLTPLSEGRFFQEKLVRLEGERVPVRVEETWEGLPNEESSRLVNREFMLGDRLLLPALNDQEWLSLAQLAESRGWVLEKSHPASRIARLRTPTPDLQSMAEGTALVNEWEKSPSAFEPDYLHFPLRTPDDPLFPVQWAYPVVNSAEAWTLTTGSEETVVAVIDSGADLTHPDLVGNLWQNPNENPNNSIDDDGNGFINDMVGWDFADWNNNPDDQHGHGTHVAGIIGAVGNNQTGIAGAAWNVRLMILRVGDQSFSTERIINALDYVTDLRENRGIPVVATNNSYGAFSRSRFLEEAINRSRQAGLAFVAAAGNNGVNMDVGARVFPAGYGVDNIIATAATTQTDQLWSSSNYGSFVHLGAPGVGIRSTERNGGYGNRQGTSMAAPMVTGTLALMASANPELDWQDLKNRLLDSVDPIPALEGRTATGGRLNMGRAVAHAAIRSDQLVITSPSVPALRLENAENQLVLEWDWAGDQNEIPAGSPVWITESGPSEAEFFFKGSQSATAFFSEKGDYRLRAQFPGHTPLVVSGVLHVTVGSNPPVQEGLAARWNLDTITHGILTDESGENRDGTLLNTAPSNGQMGDALSFNGVNSRMTFNAPSTEDVTLAAWIRPQGSGNSIFPRVFDLPEFLLFTGAQPGGPVPNRNTLRFLADRTGGEGIWHSPTNVVRNDVWQHVAVTFRGGAGNDWPIFYHDGQPVPTIAQIFPNGGREASGGTGLVGNSANGNRAWEGRMEGLRIYRRALAPDEVAALALEPRLPRLPSLQPSLLSGTNHQAGEPIELTAFATPTHMANRSVYREMIWTLLEGPGTVDLFEADEAGVVTAVFSQFGTYILQLEARAKEAAATATLTVEISPSQPRLSLETSTDALLLWPVDSLTVTVLADQPPEEDLMIDLRNDTPAVIDLFAPPALPSPLILRAGEDRVSFSLSPLPLDPETLEAATLRLALPPNTSYQTSDRNEVSVHLLPPVFANWLARYFDHLPSAEDVAELAARDLNGNGIPALLEYALGIDPLAGNSAPALPLAGRVEREGNRHLSFTFTRPRGTTGVIYDFEVSSSLDNNDWLSGGEQVQVESVIDHGDGTETITVVDQTPLDGAFSRFMRLRVSLP